ncbi:regulatory protein RecX [Deferribacter thermophilus]|uniref:regulatory protein RecX n=1 Tax=Deferribacter thermophilus TaxID=53573 RepID=UPI003C28122D
MKKMSESPENYILNILNRKDYTEFELTQKLKLKFNLSNEEITSLITKFKNLNFINDKRYKSRFIINKLLNKEGPYLIKQKLNQKGIEVEISEINEIANKENISIEQNAKELVAKRLSIYKKEPYPKLKKKFLNF